jgi:ABC-type sugar transport system permease subunit
MVLIAAVNAYPSLMGLVYSFRDGSLLETGNFVGVANYAHVLDMPLFAHAIRFSLMFAAITLVGCIAIGLVFSHLLNADIPCRNFFRASLLIPWIVPSVVAVVCWRWLVVDSTSPANQLLGLFRIGPIYFLSDETWAMAIVCLAKIWKSSPFVTVSLLAALQTIDPEYYEAAKIDGAGRWKSFTRITLPFLSSVLALCGILLIIWSFNDFDIIWLLTQGGPLGSTMNMIVAAYDYAFSKNLLGIGAAMSIIAFIIVMAMSVFMLKLQEKNNAAI